MKVLIATPLYPPEIGGPATYAKLLEDELPGRGTDIVLVKFSDVRHLPKGVAHMAYAWRLFKAARGADLILALDQVSVGLPAALVAFIRRKPFVVKIVGDYAWEQGQQRYGVAMLLDEFVQTPGRKFALTVQVLRKVEYLVARSAKCIIVPSKYLRKIVMEWGVPSRKIDVVYNAFDPVFESLECEPLRQQFGVEGKLLFSAGRLVPWKGFATLIRLMPEIHKVHPGTKLFIAGSGPLETELKRLISELHLEENVILLGNVPHEKMMEYICAADCFVLNTGYEGLSHQLLEVLAVGTPIVTTKVGGNPELIEGGRTGLLTEYDDKEALTKAILMVLSREVRLPGMVEAGRQFVARFTVERMISDTLAVLENVIRK